MSRVMEVFHIEDDLMHFDYFPENVWNKVVTNFFIEGGLTFPEEIDQEKSISELTDDDYKLFFEEIGYEVIGFEKYDSSNHIKHVVNIPDETAMGKS